MSTPSSPPSEPPRSIAAPAAGSYTKAAVSGMKWTAVAIGVGKLASLLAQYALGWLLAEDDFALFGLAISLGAIVSALRDAGATTFLMQRGSSYDDLAGPVARVALLFNVAAAVLLALMAVPAAGFFDAPGLPPLVWILAAAIPLNTPGAVLRAKLSIDLRFRERSRITALSAIIRHGAAIGFALLGCGPLSFVLPLLLVPLYEWAALSRACGMWPGGRALTRTLFAEIFTAARWLMIGALASTLLGFGDYMVVGWFEPDLATLGIYFFGFQLTVAVASLFSAGLQSVLMPTLAQLGDEPQRQAQAYLRALRVLVFVLAPVCVGAAVVVDPMIRILWAGKWDAAIPVAQLMSLSLAVRLLVPASRSMIEAQGRWRLRGVLLWIDGLLLLASAAVGAVLGGLLSITVWVAGYRFVGGLAMCLVVSVATSVGVGRTLRAIAAPIVVSGAVGAVCFWIFEVLRPIEGPLPRFLAAGASFVALNAALALPLMPARWRELRSALLGGRPRSSG